MKNIKQRRLHTDKTNKKKPNTNLFQGVGGGSSNSRDKAAELKQTVNLQSTYVLAEYVSE